MGTHPEVYAHYRPHRVALPAALAAAGTRAADIALVVNCHLHFDHCGGNPELAGRPVVTQRVELDPARHTADDTLPDLVDAPGLRYEVLDGEAEIRPGVLARRADRDRHGGPLPPVPGWLDRLQRLDPARVLFAHDHAVWEP